MADENEIFILDGNPWEIPKPKDPRIGPHEGCVAELMLSGQKPVCRAKDFDPSDNVPALLAATEQGSLIYGGFIEYPATHDTRGYKAYYFCQPGQEENMAELIRLFEEAEKEGMDDACHTRVGQLLGYSSDEIEVFLNHRHRVKAEREQWEKDQRTRAPVMIIFTP